MFLDFVVDMHFICVYMFYQYFVKMLRSPGGNLRNKGDLSNEKILYRAP
jgi:hypothetical protein